MSLGPRVLLLGDSLATDREAVSVVGFVEEQLKQRGARVEVLLPEGKRRGPRTQHDGVLVVSRERNRSYSGRIKNLIDGMDPDQLAGRPVGLMSYTQENPVPTAVDHLRVIVCALRGIPIPSEAYVSVSQLGYCSDKAGWVAQPDGGADASVSALVSELIQYSSRMRLCDHPATPDLGFAVAHPVNGNVCEEIAEAVTFIRANFTDPSLCLDMVASSIYMSRYHFSRKFREQTGRRFIDYVIMLRMTEARRLLLQTESTITSISASVGYRDLSNFERSFKRFFEVSPTQYRIRYAQQVSQSRICSAGGLASDPGGRQIARSGAGHV